MSRRTLQEGAVAIGAALAFFGIPALMSAAKLAGWW